MIIEEKNQFEKEREKTRKIKSLWNINLPKKYFLSGREIRYKSFLNTYVIAEIDIKEDILIINFEEEEDYKNLKKYFKDSEIKFKLDVGGFYY